VLKGFLLFSRLHLNAKAKLLRKFNALLHWVHGKDGTDAKSKPYRLVFD
jgi:hypothetical protein